MRVLLDWVWYRYRFDHFRVLFGWVRYRYRFDWGTVPLLFRIIFLDKIIWGKGYGYCFVSGNLGARPKCKGGSKGGGYCLGNP